MKLTRGEREVDDVSDCRDKNRCAFLEKPGGDKIRIRLHVRTVRQNLKDFRFRRMCKRGEIRRLSGVARERQTEVGYFVCDEGSKAVVERYLE